MKMVILAGGAGTRLWPASTPQNPKQFLDLNGEGSLLLQTLRRCAIFNKEELPYIVTRKDYALRIRAMMTAFNPECDAHHIILEPAPRSTFPAILLAVNYLLTHDRATKEEVIFVLPSDHAIDDIHKLATYMKLGEQLALNGYIVTFGAVPDRPETGYGYIKASMSGTPLSGNVEWLAQAIPVESFKEKPDLETARHYLLDETYYWNTGIFAFTIATLFNDLHQTAPEVIPLLKLDYANFLNQFNTLSAISFDYAVMEKTERAVVVPMDTSWSDLGSWDSVYRAIPLDEHYNGIQGEVIATETMGSLLINYTSQPMAAIGLQNIIAVQTDEGLLITQRETNQFAPKENPSQALKSPQ